MCVILNSLFDREMKVFYVTQMLKQGNNIKTNCPNYILKFKNMNSLLLYPVSLYSRTDQDRSCHRKSCHCYYSFQTLSKYILFNAR